MGLTLNVNTDLCPCDESGKLIKDCRCLQSNGRLLPQQKNTEPPPPQTNYAHPGCYMATTRDCSKKISREHYISLNVLELIQSIGGSKVSGFPWIPEGETRDVSASALAANILCERHNAALSGLDSVAGRLFLGFKHIEEGFFSRTTTRTPACWLFNGYDIERWMLKILCGATFSGNASTNSGTTIDWAPPADVVDLLLGRLHLPNRCGLYLLNTVGDSVPAHIGFAFAPILDEAVGVYGARLEICGFSFVYTMHRPPDDLKGTLIEDASYRPSELFFDDGSIQQCVRLGWNADIRENSIGLGWIRHSSGLADTLTSPAP